MYRRRNRRVRPATQTTLVLITFVLSAVIWVCWEAGRTLTRIEWWRAVIVLTSGLTLVLFAVGDYLQ